MVFIDGDLTAVLTRLGPDHSALEGRWHVEHAFGLNLIGEQIFQTTDEACVYLERLRAAKR